MNARALRGALRSLLCLACFAPGLAQPVAEGGLDAGTVVVVLLLWAYGGVRSTLSELDPVEEESFLAQRARKLVLLPAGMAFGGALLFPLISAWPFVWFVLALAAVLQRYGFVAEVAAGLTWLAGLGGCAQILLDPDAAWVLGPVLLLWFVVPSLDRYADAEGRVRPLPSPVPLLQAGAGVAACVLALTAAIALLLPDPFPALARTPELHVEPSGVAVPRLPIAQLGIGALILGTLWIVAQRLTQAAADRMDPPPPSEMQVELGSESLGGAVGSFAWKTSPRRAVVEAYLAHRRLLARRGVGDDGALTPRQWASRLPEGRSADVARAFEKARWSPEEVSEEEVRVLRAWIAEVEGANPG
ncbi:MAG: DUF4129 domain-containing protein [Planctomycetes bacterium]|nr:DUF4129 domain-containing protein [Planctomycetota bacterium]